MLLSVLQFKEFLGTYNKVTENCFMDCVKDFTSRDVKPEEVSSQIFSKSPVTPEIYFDWLIGRSDDVEKRFRSSELMISCDVTSSLGCLTHPVL